MVCLHSGCRLAVVSLNGPDPQRSFLGTAGDVYVRNDPKYNNVLQPTAYMTWYSCDRTKHTYQWPESAGGLLLQVPAAID